MNIVQAVVLGIVEGVTEFLPISSTGHLTIVEKLMGLPLGDAAVTAFTAIIQTGAILAVIVYFRRDISTLATVWVRGTRRPQARARKRRPCVSATAARCGTTDLPADAGSLQVR